MQNKDLELIKKYYGEKFSHLCRTLFPTILENEGELSNMILNKFAPTRSLYDAVLENQSEFQDYIYSINVADRLKADSIDTGKTPEQLMDEAGYILHPECKSIDDVLKFKKYYTQDEAICTFNCERLKTCRVWFATKKDVDKIKRENYSNPQRQDDYGTSVISIQFTKTEPSFLSIKNRYNVAVKNPDATFSNNLDNIAKGLTKSFEKKYSLNLCAGQCDELFLHNFVLANDGMYYKAIYEKNGVSFCENNIVVRNGNIESVDKSKNILFDDYVIDLSKKSVYHYENPRKKDAFIQSLGEITNVILSLDEKRQKIVDISTKKGGKVQLVLNSKNEVLSYTNYDVEKIGNNFMSSNLTLKNLCLPNLTEVGDNFLEVNKTLENLEIPQLKKVGNKFLCANRMLKEFNAPNLQSAKNTLLFHNIMIEKINVPLLEAVGNNAFYCNENLESVSMPNLVKVGESFVYSNKKIKDFNAPKLEKIAESFLGSNVSLSVLNLPNLKSVAKNILRANKNVSLISPQLKRKSTFVAHNSKSL